MDPMNPGKEQYMHYSIESSLTRHKVSTQMMCGLHYVTYQNNVFVYIPGCTCVL